MPLPEHVHGVDGRARDEEPAKRAVRRCKRSNRSSGCSIVGVRCGARGRWLAPKVSSDVHFADTVEAITRRYWLGASAPPMVESTCSVGNVQRINSAMEIWWVTQRIPVNFTLGLLSQLAYTDGFLVVGSRLVRENIANRTNPGSREAISS